MGDKKQTIEILTAMILDWKTSHNPQQRRDAQLVEREFINDTDEPPTEMRRGWVTIFPALKKPGLRDEDGLITIFSSLKEAQIECLDILQEQIRQFKVDERDYEDVDTQIAEEPRYAVRHSNGITTIYASGRIDSEPEFIHKKGGENLENTIPSLEKCGLIKCCSCQYIYVVSLHCCPDCGHDFCPDCEMKVEAEIPHIYLNLTGGLLQGYSSTVPVEIETIAFDDKLGYHYFNIDPNSLTAEAESDDALEQRRANWEALCNACKYHG